MNAFIEGYGTVLGLLIRWEIKAERRFEREENFEPREKIA